MSPHSHAKTEPSNQPLSNAAGSQVQWFFYGGAALVAALCALLFVWGLWKVPFYDKGEPREGLVVWEIWHHGEWILPLRGGVDIPSKPPLFHWIAALVSLAAGTINEFTVRSPSALLALLGVLAVYLAAARLWGVGAGLVSAIVLATSSEWWRAATSARVDMTLTFFMLCAFLYFYFLYKAGGGLWPSLLLAFFAGLATLAKGPVGVALPGIAALAFLWLKRDLAFVKRLYLPLSIPFGFAVAGTWYLLACLQGGERFFLRQILHEIVGTPLGAAGHNHNIFYYIAALLAGMAPWSLFFPGLAFFLFTQRRRLAEKELLYPLIWFAAVFVVFSLALGKRSVYILPLYPAAALLFGAWWRELSSGASPAAGGVKASTVIVAASLAVVGVVLAFEALGWDVAAHAGAFLRIKDRSGLPLVAEIATRQRTALFLIAAASAAAAFVLIRGAWKNSWNGVFAATALVCVVSLCAIQNLFHPALAASFSFKDFMARAAAKAPPGAAVVLYNRGSKAVDFYARAYFPGFEERTRTLKPPFLMLIWENEWEPLRGEAGLTELQASENTGWDGGHERLFLVSAAAGAPMRLPELAEPADDGGEP